jgi:1-acyl-sn-glycerol-3-phosphate acyltransferase
LSTRCSVSDEAYLLSGQTLPMLNKVILILRSSLFYSGYAFATVLTSLLLLALCWLVPLRKRFVIYATWCSFVLFWLRVTCGIRYQVSGLKNIPKVPVVVLSNHQSTWETIFLYKTFSPVCPILKKELLKIPFWGWAMALQKPIAIDRSRPREAGKYLLTQGKLRLQEGLSVVIFPEGTRTTIGAIKKFSRGGAQLAVASNAPIIPVVHNAGQCWPPGTFIKFPGTISVLIGEPIHAQGRGSGEVTGEFEVWVRSHKADALAKRAI